MNELIIIKYGELTTKKGNIRFFLKTLKKNVESALEGLDFRVEYDAGRMFVFSDDLETVKKRLKYVFGIHEIAVGYSFDMIDIESLKDNLKKVIKDEKIDTFKVSTKRSYKAYPLTSMEVSAILGGIVLKTVEGSRVDVHDPKTVINVEIRKDKSYIYMDGAEEGAHGYPLGVQGKGLLMLSGGIDSPVAGYMAMKRGVRLEGIYFESPPHTSDAAKEKVKSLTKILSNYSGYIKLHVINFTEIQETIYKNVPHEYLITIMRRMMYRIAERIAHKANAKVIVNGESIGQVASQTLTSMACINEVVKMPVIRPVACLDKLEIISLAKKIGTYETSILPYEDCCTIFVPEHPVINPELSKCLEYESLIDFEELLKTAIKNEEVITITKKDKNFEDLL
ncbi:MAG TPA: tRNA 4-thiouridine(8) synthase ThiI [Firmicutes bacterium]|nr:tRNA 4-thiouridine(8) synthase ThiI [Bacillota bacterium]